MDPGRKWANLTEISPLILLFCEGIFSDSDITWFSVCTRLPLCCNYADAYYSLLCIQQLMCNISIKINGNDSRKCIFRHQLWMVVCLGGCFWHPTSLFSWNKNMQDSRLLPCCSWGLWRCCTVSLGSSLPTQCPKTSITNYTVMLLNIPEDWLSPNRAIIWGVCTVIHWHMKDWFVSFSWQMMHKLMLVCHSVNELLLRQGSFFWELISWSSDMDVDVEVFVGWQSSSWWPTNLDIEDFTC